MGRKLLAYSHQKTDSSQTYDTSIAYSSTNLKWQRLC
jgi:hypothetical protein